MRHKPSRSPNTGLDFKRKECTVGAHGKHMMSQTTLDQHAHVKPKASILMQNLAVAAFGLAVLFAVGFLPMEAAHNAAHDTRHALAFPCH